MTAEPTSHEDTAGAGAPPPAPRTVSPAPPVPTGFAPPPVPGTVGDMQPPPLPNTRPALTESHPTELPASVSRLSAAPAGRHSGNYTKYSSPSRGVRATIGPQTNTVTSAQDGRTPLPAGTKVGDYTISSQIGIGGFGITYFAKHTVEGTPVAIKEHIPEGLATREPNSNFVIHSSPEREARFKATLDEFQEEITVLMGLSHPGIIPILAAFTANGTAYYVMPFQDGTPMSIVEQATLDYEQQAQNARHNKRLLLSMLSTLDYLRMHQIVHRDIKTDNILVTPEGSTVLLDFGSARQLQPGKVFTNVYTPDFCAPEQSRARTDEEMSEHIGPWTDIYALGVCFYYLITHLFPPRSDLRIIAGTDPYTPLAGRADLEKLYGLPFLRAIDRALELNVRDRWQSAAAWRMAIEQGVITKPPRTTHSIRIVLGMLCVMLVILGGVSLWALNERARTRRAIDNNMRFVEHMLNDFNQELTDIPGSTRLQRIFGQHLDTFLNGIELSERGLSEQKILRPLTASWRNFGAVCLQQGKLEEADKAFERAAGYMRRLRLVAPDTPTYTYELAETLLHRVAIARSRNQNTLERSYLSEARELLLQLSTLEPANPDYNCTTAQALIEEAYLARAENNHRIYRESVGAALEILTRLQDLYPDHVRTRENLGLILQYSAQYELENGNFTRANTQLDEAKNLFTELIAQFPYRLSFQKGLALNYYTQAQLYDRLSATQADPALRDQYVDMALDALKKQTELANHLETQDEAKAEYPYMACQALSAMVDILLRTGRPNLAEAYSNTIMRKTDKLRAAAPDNVNYAVMEANAWRGLATSHSRASRYAMKASDEFSRFRECVEGILKLAPANNNILLLHSDSLAESAAHAAAIGQLVQAGRWYRQAASILEDLLRQSPDNTTFMDRLHTIQTALNELPTTGN